MALCQFCKKSLPGPRAGQCPSCGRAQVEVPSLEVPRTPSRGAMAAVSPAAPAAAGGGWGEDGMELERGGGQAGGAVGSAYSGGGMAFGDDDPFADDAAGAAPLELDGPARRPSAGSLAAVQVAAPLPEPVIQEAASRPPVSRPPASVSHPPSSTSIPAGGPPGGSLPAQPMAPPAAPPPAPAPPDPAAMIARFPLPPAKVWETPLYAFQVLWRQYELRQDLASLRKRRSPDVPLYERALRLHDARTFGVGVAIACAVFAVAAFLLCLPMILRSIRGYD